MRSDIELNYLAIKLREDNNEDELSCINIFDIAKAIENLTLVFYPLGDNISGICIKQNNSNVIAINSNMSIGRQRFSLGHELYHLFYDSTIGTTISSIDNCNNMIEKEADNFASYLLAPYNSLARLIDKCDELTIENVIKLEQTFKMSHQAMLTRLLKDGFIDELKYIELKEINIIKESIRYGYETDLYTIQNDNYKKTYGNYIKQAQLLKNKDIISTGSYNEYMLDAFRDDLVFNSKQEDING